MGFNDEEARLAGSATPRALPVQILDYASGFLMAFGAQLALIKQRETGGSYHVQVSLAQTATWLRQLGHIDNNFYRRDIDLERRLIKSDSGFGELAALPHAANISGVPPTWPRPSMPPGTHELVWP